MTMIEDINALTVIATAIATIVLAIVTGLYLIETKKIRLESEKYRKTFIDETEKSRIEAKKPILSFQSSDYPGDRYQGLFLCNCGPIARNVTIVVTCGEHARPAAPLFLYTLGTGERINICGEWNTARDARQRITVEAKFHDADMRQYNPPPMVIYYSMIAAETTIAVPVFQPIRVDCYQMNNR